MDMATHRLSSPCLRGCQMAMTSSPKENSSQISLLAPLMVPHLFWRVSILPWESLPLSFDCLIDDGSHLVLIHKSLVKQLQIHCCKLHFPIETRLAMKEHDKKITVTLHKYVHLSLFDGSGQYSTQTIHAIITPNLCSPVILGFSFLKHNKIVINHDKCTVIGKTTGFDLLNPSVWVAVQAPRMKLKDLFKKVSTTWKEASKELDAACGEQLKRFNTSSYL